MNHRADKQRIEVPEPQYFIHKDGRTVKQTQHTTLRNYGICWGFPMDETMFSIWFSNFLYLPRMPWDSITVSMNTYLPMARNAIHKNFLDTGLEWLVMLDSDVMPPPNFLDRLLSHGKKMAGGWYRKKGDGCPVVYDFNCEKDGVYYWDIRKAPGKGLEKVDAAGAGCWLMHRDVAKAIGEKPYDELKGGEDLDLCKKVSNAGFDIYIDWEIACAHAGVGVI